MANYKRINLSLTEQQYNLVKQVAESKNLAPTALATKLVMQGLTENNIPENIVVDESGATDKRKLTFHLTDKDAQVLRQKASRLSLTNIAYIRNLIHTKDFVINEVITDDIQEYIAEVGSAIQQISSFVGMIKRYNNGEIFRQDIKKMEEYILELRKILNTQIKLTYANRVRAYNYMIGKNEIAQTKERE